jgi:hypothetical protein
MWTQDSGFRRVQNRHDGNLGRSHDLTRRTNAHPDLETRAAQTCDWPVREHLSGRPSAMFHVSLGPSRLAGGYEPEWCRA